MGTDQSVVGRICGKGGDYGRDEHPWVGKYTFLYRTNISIGSQWMWYHWLMSICCQY